MKYPPSNRSSSNQSELSDSEPDDHTYATDLTDFSDSSDDNLDAGVNKNKEDPAWLLQGNIHPPEYYTQLGQDEEDSDEEQDYSPNSTILLDTVEGLWFQYVIFAVFPSLLSWRSQSLYAKSNAIIATAATLNEIHERCIELYPKILKLSFAASSSGF